MYYNVTSVFLGVGVILVWVGLLRFFQYFNKYNVSDPNININIFLLSDAG